MSHCQGSYAPRRIRDGWPRLCGGGGGGHMSGRVPRVLESICPVKEMGKTDELDPMPQTEMNRKKCQNRREKNHS